MLVNELAPKSHQLNLGCPWVRVDERNTMVPRVSPETSLSVSFSSVRAILYFCADEMWGTLTYGAQQPVAVGALDRVHLAAKLDLNFDFFYYSRFCSKFQKFISRARSVSIE